MKFSSYIPDGYTRPFYIEAVEYVHGPLRGVYRPILTERRSIILSSVRKDTTRPDEAERITAKAVLQQLTEWDFTDDKGEAVSPSVDAMLRRMEPRLFQRLAAIVLGYGASDRDPEWTPSEQDDEDERLLQRALSGEGFEAEAEEEADTKNSETASC